MTDMRRLAPVLASVLLVAAVLYLGGYLSPAADRYAHGWPGAPARKLGGALAAG